MGEARTSIENVWERFHDKLMKVPDGCWLWTASLTSTGYGQLFVGTRNRKAHQIGYELYRGGVPSGLQLDHLCRQRTCVNPWHLEPVTARENLHRGIDAVGHHQSNKTHCIHGHEFTPENTYRYPTSSRWPHGRRECRTCSTAYKANWQTKNKETLN